MINFINVGHVLDQKKSSILFLPSWIMQTCKHILKVLQILLKLVGPGYMKYPGVDYHGHHDAEYDWRTDPSYNQDLETDPRGKDFNLFNRAWVSKS